MIQTVLGDIPATTLGVTMSHEHVAMDLSLVRGEEDSVFTDFSLLFRELSKLKELGANALIEASTIDMNRDVAMIQKLSQATGLHMVASTGFYLQAYHPDWLREKTKEEIAAIFLSELTRGIGDTGIKAGVIGEVATGNGVIAPGEERVLRAAALASQEAGCAVITHCDMATMAEEQIKLMKQEQMNLDKLVLSHLDLTTDNEYHRKLLEQGVTLAFDTVGKTSYLSDEKRADAFVLLVEQGYEKQLLLSQDISRKSYMMASGGLGYTAVLGHFVPLLKEKGIREETLAQILVENPARIFRIE